MGYKGWKYNHKGTVMTKIFKQLRKKTDENMSYVGKDVSQKLSYDNWLKKVKGIDKGAHGIKGDEHTKLSKQWKDYRGKEKLAAAFVKEAYKDELTEGRMKELHTLIQQGKSAEEIAKIMKLDVKTIKSLMPKEEVNEVSPPGWGGSVKAMKKHADIDNPYALAWHMKNKGDKPHYKDKDGTPVKKDKYKDEQMEQVTEDKGYTDQQIKQAYGILNDPRYKQGNYSGAHKAIEKIAKGLASHPDVANALKRANEELTEKLDVKWDKDKEGWYDKQGRRRYLGKAATQDLLGKQIAKAKASGDWSSFDIKSSYEQKEDHDCEKVHPAKSHKEWEMKKENKYFDTKPGSIEDSIVKMKELEETSVTINKKEIDDLVKQYISKGGVVTKLPPALAPGETPPKEWDLVKGKSVPGSGQGQIAYKVKKVGSGYKILKASLREFIKLYNEHFLTTYSAEEFIVEEEK